MHHAGAVMLLLCCTAAAELPRLQEGSVTLTLVTIAGMLLQLHAAAVLLLLPQCELLPHSPEPTHSSAPCTCTKRSSELPMDLSTPTLAPVALLVIWMKSPPCQLARSTAQDSSSVSTLRQQEHAATAAC
jgi:hypothetical protein